MLVVSTWNSFTTMKVLNNDITSWYRGHYITNPNKAPLRGNPSTLPNIFALFDPPKWGNSMIPVVILINVTSKCILGATCWLAKPVTSLCRLNELRIQVSLAMGWQHLSCLRCDVLPSTSTTPGDVNLPISDLAGDFPPANFHGIYSRNRNKRGFSMAICWFTGE